MGRFNSRDKGQRGEREVADMLTTAFPENGKIRRNIDQAAEGGEDISMIEGFSIEVKWQESFLLPQWWEQAVTQAQNSSIRLNREIIPALVYKRNRVKWRVRLPLRLYVPYAHVDKTIEVSWEEFILVIRHEHGVRTR